MLAFTWQTFLNNGTLIITSTFYVFAAPVALFSYRQYKRQADLEESRYLQSLFKDLGIDDPFKGF